MGISNTLLLCVLTAFIGSFLVRTQGLQTFNAARESLQKQSVPLKEIFDGICIAISGALLLTPGFFTDVIGFSLLIPQLRQLARDFIASKFEFKTNMHNAGTPSDPDIIEAEYIEVEPEEVNDEDNKP